MPIPRHRGLRRRSLVASLALVLLGSALFSFSSGPPPAQAASAVSKEVCRRFDPNLVNGVCLSYRSASGSTGYTWIGSYRASNNKVFFCIDYLYDSRITGTAATVSTDPLVNQLGARIGDAEVAALNYVISTWAPTGSSGTDVEDAAIALIIREVMSDATRPDGTVVYRPGLKVGGTVAAPVGGLAGPVIDTARGMWSKAAVLRGPGKVVLAGAPPSDLPLGGSVDLRVAVLSATGHLTPGVRVTFTCTGPVTCPGPVTTTGGSVPVSLVPRGLGTVTIKAAASVPSADGRLLQLPTWRTHGGTRAANSGVQRGWIAGRQESTATAAATTVVVRATPKVTTKAGSPTAVPGAGLRDLVTVTGVPAGSRQTVTATLFGPFAEQPGKDSCTPGTRVAEVTFPVAGDGTFTTPPVTADAVGFYVWTESLPGDALTTPVTTPCGVVEETTVVREPERDAAQPRVRTRASSQHVLLGAAIHDEVEVSGIAGGPVRVLWTLHGPLAPRDGSCAGLDWAGAPVLATGSFLAEHDGVFRTAGTRLTAPGCFTFSEEVAATPTSKAARTRPGEAAETALAVRPALPVAPEIPSGR